MMMMIARVHQLIALLQEWNYVCKEQYHTADILDSLVKSAAIFKTSLKMLCKCPYIHII